MSKLLDMFAQARRAAGGAGMGFLGKNRAEGKPRAAALIVELHTADAGSAESAVKAGADGLLFTWDGADTAGPEALKPAIEAARASSENVVCGLHITGDWDTLTRESIEHLKDQGFNYIILPLQAPARLLALHIKDFDTVVTVPMREGELYPLLIRSVSTFDTIAAVYLDFGLTGDISRLTIEDMLQYRAVRDAVRFPAMLNIEAGMDEADAYTLTALGIQAVILPAGRTDNATRERIRAVRELLEKVYQDDKDKPTVIKP